MATQWMDDFQGFGTDGNRVTRMSDGPYGVVNRIDLVADPDPTAGGTYVCKIFGGGTGGELRRILNGAQTVVGAAGRFWINTLPTSTGFPECPRFLQFKDVSALIHIEVTINPSGFIEVYRQDTGSSILLGAATTTLPTNGWNHIEAKVVFNNATSGSVQVRVNGLQYINLTGIRTTNNSASATPTCQMVCQAGQQDSSGPIVYLKDYIVWDNTTAVNNDFFGSCQVYRLRPASDVARNWNTTIGAAPIQAPIVGSTTGGTLAAGTYYYVVTAIMTGPGESIASNEQLVVNTGTTSSNTISWTAPTGMTITGYKVYRGTSAGAESVFYSPGNVLTFTDTGAASTAGTPPTDTGTGWNKINEVTPDEDVTFITAPTPAPAAYQALLTQLPSNVTTVRSVMTIHRSKKTDGGDASVQASLVSGANTGSGTSRPITTAYSYWWDIFEQDPSGVNWSKTLVNALKLKLDRTV